MPPEIEAIKHIGDWKDGKLVCRPDCPSSTHKTENKHTSIEDIVEEYRNIITRAFLNNLSLIEADNWLRTTLQSQADQYEREKKEMVREMMEVSDTIIEKIKSIENPPEAQSAIIHNRGFVYGVESLITNIKTIAQKHGVDLSE